MRLFCITASVSVGNELMWFTSSTSTYQLAAWLWPKLTSFTVSRISKATQNADCKPKKLPIYHRTVPSGLKLTISAMALLRQQNQAALKIVSYLLCLTGHRKKKTLVHQLHVVRPLLVLRAHADQQETQCPILNNWCASSGAPTAYRFGTGIAPRPVGHGRVMLHKLITQQISFALHLPIYFGFLFLFSFTPCKPRRPLSSVGPKLSAPCFRS